MTSLTVSDVIGVFIIFDSGILSLIFRIFLLASSAYAEYFFEARTVHIIWYHIRFADILLTQFFLLIFRTDALEPVLDQIMIQMVRFRLSRHVLFQVCQSLLNHVSIFEWKPQHTWPERVYCQKCRRIKLVKGFQNRQKMALKCFKINFIIPDKPIRFI